jgi:hypothetical protein
MVEVTSLVKHLDVPKNLKEQFVAAVTMFYIFNVRSYFLDI